jgi:hemolysin activation/secretion protein
LSQKIFFHDINSLNDNLACYQTLYLNPSISRGIDAFDALNDDESGLDLKAKLDKSFWLWRYQINEKYRLLLTLDW